MPDGSLEQIFSWLCLPFHRGQCSANWGSWAFGTRAELWQRLRVLIFFVAYEKHLKEVTGEEAFIIAHDLRGCSSSWWRMCGSSQLCDGKSMSQHAYSWWVRKQREMNSPGSLSPAPLIQSEHLAFERVPLTFRVGIDNLWKIFIDRWAVRPSDSKSSQVDTEE